MKKIKYITFCITFIGALVISIVLSSCSAEDVLGNCNEKKLTNLTKVIFEKEQAYKKDASIGNCNAYRKAIYDFIDAAKDCPGVENKISEFEKQLKDLTCDEQ